MLAAAQVGKWVDFVALLMAVSKQSKYEFKFKRFYVGPPADTVLIDKNVLVNYCAPQQKEPSPAEWYNALQREIEAMGYHWVCCEPPGSRQGQVKTNVDIVIATDLVTWAKSPRYDIYLAGGDGDYLIAVQRVRQLGARLCLLGIMAARHVSRALLNEVPPADCFDMEAMENVLCPLLVQPDSQDGPEADCPNRHKTNRLID